MILTLDLLEAIAGRTVDRANARSMLAGLATFSAGLDAPHRLAQYLAQLMHESGAFRWDQEIWGPTAAQKRYDTRTDLGNTPEVDGDGHLFRGRGPMQITGRYNYRRFRDWCEEEGLLPPDFEADPDAVLTDPWEGLGPIWYWTTRGLNRFADAGDAENITRRINGGLNGYADRLRYLTRTSLVFLGRDADDVRGFQLETPGLKVDGVAGTNTRAALHRALVTLPIEVDPISTLLLTIDLRLAAIEARLDLVESRMAEA